MAQYGTRLASRPSLKVIIDKEKGCYGPGDIISGYALLENKIDLNIDDITLRFCCESTAINTALETHTTTNFINQEITLYKTQANRAKPLLKAGHHTWTFSFTFPTSDVLPPNLSFLMSGPTKTQKVSTGVLSVVTGLLLMQLCCLHVPFELPWSKAAYISYGIEATMVGYDLPRAITTRHAIHFSPDRLTDLEDGHGLLEHRKKVQLTIPPPSLATLSRGRSRMVSLVQPLTWNRWTESTFDLVIHVPRFVILNQNLPLHLSVSRSEQSNNQAPAAAIILKYFSIKLHSDTVIGKRPRAPVPRGVKGYIGETLRGPSATGLSVEINGRIDLRTLFPSFKLLKANMEPQPHRSRIENETGSWLVPTFETDLVKRTYYLTVVVTIQCAGVTREARFKGGELTILPVRLSPGVPNGLAEADHGAGVPPAEAAGGQLFEAPQRWPIEMEVEASRASEMEA
jgi:hypothetical protein